MNTTKDISKKVISYGVAIVIIIAYKDDKKVLVDPDELNWRIYQDYYEELTLKEIEEQLKELGYESVYVVWEELGLNGYIYRYGNYEPEGWEEHGHTRGFA